MNILNDLVIALPEVFLALMVFALLVFDGLTKSRHLAAVHWISVLVSLCIAAYCFWVADLIAPRVAFNDMYVSDTMGLVLKGFTGLAVAITLIYSRLYVTDRGLLKGEFYGLALFGLLGQMVMISANNLLLVYLGIELLSLSLYAAVALRRDHAASTEAAMKYFVLGALASGFLLYGMSMIYGATGSLELADIARSSVSVNTDKTILAFGLVFLVAGLAFKLGAVPFHMWVPDVYEGSPTAIALLIGGAPKLATFAILIRLLVDGLLAMATDWQPMLLILAILSIALGNLTAIAQKNLKRMLAYSTISHMGYMLLGLVSGVTGENGVNTSGAVVAYSASMFYVIVYVLATLGTFGVMLLLARQGHECDQIDDLKGLSRRAPWLAFAMLLMMFSLMGIPPTVGFYAKLAVLQPLLMSGQTVWAVVAVVFSLIGAFYYLRVVKTMYFDDAPVPLNTPLSPYAGVLLVLNGLAILALGILPAPLMALCSLAMERILGS
ncbi:MAG: NADH-quinone oxidoreductase subunit NuoN [Burkholderiaceae bacterium]